MLHNKTFTSPAKKLRIKPSHIAAFEYYKLSKDV